MNRSIERRLDRLETQWRKGWGKKIPRPFPQWMEDDLQRCPWAAGLTAYTATDRAEWQYDALPAQREFHLDLTARFKGYSGPIGSGKSFALVYEALFLSRMNPGLLGLIGAPTYRMLQDSTQRTFFDVLAAEDIDYTFRKQENRIRLTATGSEIIFRTMENPERLRGANLAWFALDELTYTSEDAWNAHARPPAPSRCPTAVWLRSLDAQGIRLGAPALR
jgi:hypothetical protein